MPARVTGAVWAEHSGLAHDPWPQRQMWAYHRGVAAILRHVGLDADSCVGHKEYAPTRKIDPCFDMDGFRGAVRALLEASEF
jgi:N-acetyl-anhydromuramyl-L-alanine amidase AmpD